MKSLLFFLILATMASCTPTLYINSPARVVGVMEDPKNPGDCKALLAYASKNKKRIKEAWISAKCNQYLVSDTLIHTTKSDIQIVRHLTEDKD